MVIILHLCGVFIRLITTEAYSQWKGQKNYMIPFLNLGLLHNQLADEINVAVQRAVGSGWYILGPEVEAFEAEFAAYHGAAHAIGVANGTDAIELALLAAGIGTGDEVITVAHTAMPTVTAIEATGAKPVFADIDPATFTIDPKAVEAAITPRTKAIIPVHLYGQPADLKPLVAIAEAHHLFLLEDCAQGHGGRYNGQIVGTFGHAASFSFYPTKNLGAYGDGGAIITNDSALAERLKRLRFYGQSSRYTYVERGTNSRLDELQAAILRVKLKYLDAHNQQRRDLAAIYNAQLSGVTIPYVLPNVAHVYHLYVVRHPARDALMEDLKARGVGTLIHYPVPIHRQQSHLDLGYAEGSLPHTEQAAREIVSLPLYIGLTPAQAQAVAEAVKVCAS